MIKFNGNLRKRIVFLILFFGALTIFIYTKVDLVNKFLIYIFSLISILFLISELIIKKININSEESEDIIRNGKYKHIEICGNNNLETYMIKIIKKYQLIKEIGYYKKEIRMKSPLDNTKVLMKNCRNSKIKNVNSTRINKHLTGLSLKKVLLLTELIGIILGDGHISFDEKKRNYLCEISFNSTEPDYVYYVKDLIKSIFDIEPTIRDRDEDNTTLIRIYKKEIIRFLIKLGLKPGNKVLNQVDIPYWIKRDLNWIKNNRNEWENIYKHLTIACVRGLVDTDGSIYLNWNKKKNYLTIGIKFTNASKPLVLDFKNLCKCLDISFSKISTYIGKTKNGSDYTGYSTNTEAKNNVYNFIFKSIKPFKWTIKKSLIQERLTEMGMDIKDVLMYERPRRDYKKERAIYLKTLFESLGTLNGVREYLIEKGESPMKKETISKYIQKLLQDRGKSYENWISLNSAIKIDDRVIGGIRIPLNVKKIICQFIFNVLLENCIDISMNKIIDHLCYFVKVSDLDRISYLLEYTHTKNIILNFFKASTYFINYIIDHKIDRHSPTKIRRNLKKFYKIDLPYHDSQIKEIIRNLFD